jgi:NitT/TauT family transport system substrate-binding protein
MISRLVSLASLVGAFLLSASAQAETSELRIARQPGLSYLPAVIAEKLGLVEKHALAAGLKDFKVTWITLGSGGAGNDALLSGSIDMMISGGPNMLIVWGKTNGDVKGVVATGAMPMLLLTNNPKIKTLADFTEADKIALPTIKVGTQPAVLGIAVEKQFGIAGVQRFSDMQVAMSHPDGLIAMQNKSSGVTAHFTQPPFQNLELKIPGVHVVLDSTEVIGGPMSNGCVYSTTKFHDANPKVMRAFVDAIKEAVDYVAKNKRAAAELYLEANKEKLTVDELVAILDQPKSILSATPHGLLKAAQYFHRAGFIKQNPQSWKEFFFPEVYDLPGS